MDSIVHVELKNADISGYLIRTGTAENDPTKPSYEMSTRGLSTLEVISRIVYFHDEGLLSLWKGFY